MEFENLPNKYHKIWEKAIILLKQGRPGDDQHAIEVANLIMNYNGDMDIDKDVLIPVAIMHDIGHSALLPEDFKYVTGPDKIVNAKLVHMLAGAKIARDILKSIGYDHNKSEEIVDIIRVHDADQIKDIDIEKFYNSVNKKVFHDLDCMDRFTEERLKSFMKMIPDRERILKEIRKSLDVFFYPQFREMAEERMKELEG